MHTSLIETFFADSFFADSFFSPTRTVYVVSDSQLKELRHNRQQDELRNLAASRKRLEKTYHSQIKHINEREKEIQADLKALKLTEEKTKKVSEKDGGSSIDS